jgi:hypothetical protein
MVHSTYDGFLCTRATIHGKIIKPTVHMHQNQKKSPRKHIRSRISCRSTAILDSHQPKVFSNMSGKGWCADKHIERTATYLLRCPRSLRLCTKGSAKVSCGGGGGDSDSNGSGNDGNATAQWQHKGNRDGRRWTVQWQHDNNNGDGRRGSNGIVTQC